MGTNRVLLFGGTSEGRRLAEFLHTNKIDFTLSVATDYGKGAVDSIVPAGNIRKGRLSVSEMPPLIETYSLVIDATHPYAKEVTENIRCACENTGVEYMRVLRQTAKIGEQQSEVKNVKHFESNQAAIDFLNTTTENILLTTGSKEAAAYTQIKDFDKRVFIRMLPLTEALQDCIDLGFKNSNIICMQGSFSKELNIEILKMTNARYLVTKESGEAGGYMNKLSAATELSVMPVVISRPTDEDGYSLADSIHMLRQRYIKPLLKRFPLFVDLFGKLVIVVGGGKIATRRIQTLLNFTNRITVISPTISDELQNLVQEKKITWISRVYENSDIDNAFLCIAATDQRLVNSEISKAANACNIYCSIADAKEESSFWFPGIVSADNLVVGVVSDNGDHKHVKQAVKQIKDLIGKETLENEVLEL